MAQYVLVESRDPFDSSDVHNVYELAEGLAEEANDVTLFLVQNGVLPARQESSAGTHLAHLAEHVNVLADEFSLRERGIRSDELASGVKPTGIDTLVDLIADGSSKVIWH